MGKVQEKDYSRNEIVEEKTFELENEKKSGHS